MVAAILYVGDSAILGPFFVSRKHLCLAIEPLFHSILFSFFVSMEMDFCMIGSATEVICRTLERAATSRSTKAKFPSHASPAQYPTFVLVCC